MSHTAEQNVFIFPQRIGDSAEARAEIGRRVSELRETPGWADLQKGIEQYQRETGRMLMSGTPSQEGAFYADVVGQMKGVDALALIADGLIQLGQEAEQEIRLNEESG